MTLLKKSSCVYYNYLLHDLCSLPSGQVLMTWTNGRSHLTNYSVTNVSIIHCTIGAWLHKSISKVTQSAVYFIGANKPPSFSKGCNGLALILPYINEQTISGFVLRLILLASSLTLLPPFLPLSLQMGKRLFVSSWSLSSVKRTLSFGQPVRNSGPSHRTKSWRPRPTSFMRSSLKVKLPRR